MMPRTTVFALRGALIWLSIGITIGTLMLLDKSVGALALGPEWLHTHVHLLMFGFFVQTIFGVAYWMLPRFGRERPRAWLAVAAVVSVQVACVLALGFPLVRHHLHAPVTAIEVIAVVLFVIHAYPRVKEFGK